MVKVVHRLLGVQEYPLQEESTQRSRPVNGWLKYSNPWSTWSTPTLMLIVKWKRKYPKSKLVIPEPEVLDKLLPVVKPQFLEISKIDNDMALTWLGHATTFVEFDGVGIITDPVFGEKVQTFQGINFSGEPVTTPRFRPAPCQVDDLPEHLRFVLISHNHFDHLDVPSCQALNNRYGNKLSWFVPTGNGAFMKKILHTENIKDGRNQALVTELNWWECAAMKLTTIDETTKSEKHSHFEIVATPCQHWSLRSIFDKMTTLWCSWAVIGPSGRKFFYAGDTGYCSGFKEIGRNLGPFDVAAIPIGAYDPHEFLAAQHCDPAEAVMIHNDIGAKKSAAVHWGTFPFADDSLMGPKEDLEKAVADQKMPPGEFVALNHGETLLA